MPVELNEPLNTLQHLCEELEYSELLDKAAETDDPYERMVRSLVQHNFTYARAQIFTYSSQDYHVESHTGLWWDSLSKD